MTEGPKELVARDWCSEAERRLLCEPAASEPQTWWRMVVRIPARAPGYLCPAGSPATLIALLGLYAGLALAGGASTVASFATTAALSAATLLVWGLGYRSVRSLQLAFLALRMALYVRRHGRAEDAFEAFACDHKPAHYCLVLAAGALAWPGTPLIPWSDT